MTEGHHRQALEQLRAQLAHTEGELAAAREKIREQRRAIKKRNEQIASLKKQWKNKGGLPDFLIIGAQKCGTSSLYRLLCQHPHVEPASTKEVHFFDKHFDRGVGWYRSRFPSPTTRGRKKVITGESSPYYIYHPHAARRAAEVVPEARLIALLRNPVDRAYSNYHQAVRTGREPLSFEEAIEAEEGRLRGEREKMLADDSYHNANHQWYSYLTRGVYVDQLIEWRRYFGEEQMLVLKSEDFFENPQETFEFVLEFLDLPSWQPDTYERRNEGSYERMSPATRRRLVEYFEPHNQRLYEHLGTDFGW